MRPLLKVWIVFFLLPAVLTSCEFSCQLGSREENEGNARTGKVDKNGTVLYNSIDLNTRGVKLKKAWLMLTNGDRVPSNNFVDFDLPVKLILEIESGWTEEDGKVWLGASERIIDEKGRDLVNETDLFGDSEGLSPEDSKLLALIAQITLTNRNVPQSFDVHFRIWDKKSKSEIKGKYTLYSK